MGTTLTATFDTRREADLTVERLVQEHGLNRADIFVAAAGADNTAGVDRAGSDREAGQPSPEARDDAPLHGAVTVSVDIDDDASVRRVRGAFDEFRADDVVQS